MAVGIIAKNSILSKRRIYPLRQVCLLNFYLDRISSKTKKSKWHLVFLPRKKCRILLAILLRKLSRKKLLRKIFTSDVTLLIVLMHGYLMIFATDKISLSDRIRQKIVNNNNDNNNNNTDNNTLSIR